MKKRTESTSNLSHKLYGSCQYRCLSCPHIEKMQKKAQSLEVNVKRVGDKTVTTTDNNLYTPINGTDISTSPKSS